MAHWLAIVAFAAAAVAQAQPATLRVMGFAGSANLPIFIAQEKGLFAARGLRVDRKKIRLDDPIREVGTYMVEIELAGGATARIKTIVAEEK